MCLKDFRVERDFIIEAIYSELREYIYKEYGLELTVTATPFFFLNFLFMLLFMLDHRHAMGYSKEQPLFKCIDKSMRE